MNKQNNKNKKKIKKIVKLICDLFFLLSVILALIISIYIVVYRFQNPALTETQILIYSWKKFWLAYIMFIVSYFGITFWR